MKKNDSMKKILIINFLLIFFVLTIMELFSFLFFRWHYFCLLKMQKIAENKGLVLDILPEEIPRYHRVKRFVYDDYKDRIRRCYKSKHPKKRPIMTVGCSYAAGALLQDNQTLAYKLNELTGRTTYNRALSGSGPQFMYRDFSDVNIKNEVPDVEYVIYVFIQDHFYRSCRDMFQPNAHILELSYKIKDGKLAENKSPFFIFNNLFLGRLFSEYYKKIKYFSEQDKGFPLFMKIMEMSSQQIHEKYPNSKFILLDFPELAEYDNYGKPLLKLTNEQISQLKDMGITYLNTEKILGYEMRDKEKYCAEDNYHPNELVWDEVAPALVKALSL